MAYVPLKMLGGILFLLWLCLANVAKAEERPSDKGAVYEFDIPAQPLSDSLRQLSNQTETFLLFPFELVEHRIGNPVQGSYTLQQAVEVLLADSGLTGSVSEKQVLMISNARSIIDGVPDDETQNKERGSSVQRRSSLTRFGAFVGSIASVMFAAHAHGQETNGETSTLEEIIVTAERRSSDIQKTATSVSVRSGEELAQQGRYTLTDILRDIPNVSGGEPGLTAAGGAENRGGGIMIRGVFGNPGGGGSAGTLSGSSTTAVYVDGVYEGLGGDYDLQRVEVLRGPQGTLYGRSATSGVVGTYTRDPTLNEFNGNAVVQLANYTQQLYTGALNLPIGSNFAVRASVSKAQADKGYYKGAGGAYDRVHGRVKALYQATEGLSLLFGFAFEENDQNTGGCSATSPADGVVLYNNCLPVSATHNHSRQYWLNFQWDLGPVTLFYQPALRTFYQSTPGAAVTGPFNRPMTQTIETPHDQFVTQELRFASNNDSKLKWQTGFFYYWNNISGENANRWTESGALLFSSPTSRDTKDYGLFGEATYAFTDATRLTLGGRWDYTRVNTSQVYTFNANFSCNGAAPGAGCTGPAGPGIGQPEINIVSTVNENTTPSGLSSWHKTNYKVRFEHDLTPENMLYAVVSTGFSPGDVNVSSGGVTRYDAETLTAFEVGSKNRFLEDSLQLNVGVFYYDYGGFQLTVQPDANNPTNVFTMAVPARMEGVELELLYQLTSKDRVGFNYAYLDSWFVDKPADFAAYIPWEHIASSSGVTAFGTGTGSAAAPHTVNAHYEHVFTLPGSSTLLARIDGTWRSTYRYWNVPSATLTSLGPDVMNYAYIDSGATGNINVNWNSADGNFGVGAYVRNFTDRVWNTYDVRSLAPTRTINVNQSDPRTYGVILSAKF